MTVRVGFMIGTSWSLCYLKLVLAQGGALARDNHQGVVKYLRLLFTPSSFPLASIESTVE